MREKSKKRFCWSRLLVICAVCFLMLKLGSQYHRYQAIQDEVEEYQQKLTEAQDEYRRQQEHLKLYYSDSYLEQIARGSLGMVKLGEIVVSPAEISDVRELDEKIKDKDVTH
ncbi:MAG: septum formation initiator family protein [Firmicutes bacterium]|nr:septum formation initiator family protein [Bacillota bacterium]